MAISFITQLDDVMFSSALQRLAINANEGETSVTFTLKHNTSVIFSNTYTPDANGNVYIYDLNKLLDNAIIESHGSFTFVAGDVSASLVVVRCNILLSLSASSFIDEFFLSPCVNGRRITSRYRHEIINILDLSGMDVAVTATANYYLDGKLSSHDFDLETVKGFASVNVSSAQFVMPSLGRLVAYTIKAGNHSMTYEMANHNPDEAGVVYRNCFNAYETFYFSGLFATEIGHTRSTATIGGKITTYDIVPEHLQKVNTGPIPYGNEILCYDLCNSMELYLLDDDGNFGDEIVITDADIKSDNAPDSISDFVVTWKLSDRLSTKITTPKKVKLFDSTFDDTFN